MQATVIFAVLMNLITLAYLFGESTKYGKELCVGVGFVNAIVAVFAIIFM